MVESYIILRVLNGPCNLICVLVQNSVRQSLSNIPTASEQEYILFMSKNMLNQLITVSGTPTLIVNPIDSLDYAVLYLISIRTGNW